MKDFLKGKGFMGRWNIPNHADTARSRGEYSGGRVSRN